jgi:hypothetical protein
MSRQHRIRPADRKMLVRTLLSASRITLRSDGVTVLTPTTCLVRFVDQAATVAVLRRNGFDARPVSDHVLVTWPA